MAKKYFLKAIFSLMIFSIAIIATASYFIFSESLSGVSFLILGLAGIGVSSLFRIELRSLYLDLIFGIISSVILVTSAILGGIYGGISGAVIGALAGNTVASGIGAVFEGRMIEKENKIKYNRNPLTITFGKVTGCLIGAGLALIIIWLIKLVF